MKSPNEPKQKKSISDISSFNLQDFYDTPKTYFAPYEYRTDQKAGEDAFTITLTTGDHTSESIHRRESGDKGVIAYTINTFAIKVLSDDRPIERKELTKLAPKINPKQSVFFDVFPDDYARLVELIQSIPGCDIIGKRIRVTSKCSYSTKYMKGKKPRFEYFFDLVPQVAAQIPLNIVVETKDIGGKIEVTEQSKESNMEPGDEKIMADIEKDERECFSDYRNNLANLEELSKARRKEANRRAKEQIGVYDPEKQRQLGAQ